MPIYEYRCNNCQKKVSILVRGFSASPDAACPSCGSKNITRLFSSFARRRPDTAVYDDILSDPYLVKGLMANDPRALAKWSRKMSEAIGEATTPESQEILERMDAGQMPSQELITKMQEEYLSKESE